MFDCEWFFFCVAHQNILSTAVAAFAAAAAAAAA